MKPNTKAILTLLLVAAVIGYTVYNYATGKTELSTFLIFMAILVVPMFNIVKILLGQKED